MTIPDSELTAMRAEAESSVMPQSGTITRITRTADSYGKGKSETIMGKWMKARGNHDKVLIFTKVGSDMGQGKRDLTVIGNDTAMPGVGIGKLVRAHLVKKAIVSHIGLNPETQKQMIAGEMEVDLVPQGTMAFAGLRQET